MNNISKAQWIWLSRENNPDEYVQFIDSFYYEKQSAHIKISCDGNYNLYINNILVSYGQADI